MFGRNRMLKTMEALTGRPCSEAVLVQQRNMTSWVAFIVVFVLVFAVLAGFGLPAAVMGAVAGGAGGIAFALRTSYFIVGRVDDNVVLAQSSRWWANAKEVVTQKRAPVKHSLGTGMLAAELELFGESFFLSRAFRERFQTVVS